MAEEAMNQAPMMVDMITGIFDRTPRLLNFQGDLSFVVVTGAQTPFRCTFIKSQFFIVVIDLAAFYALTRIVGWARSLPALAEIMGVDSNEFKYNFRGMYLMDITKTIIFRSEQVKNPDIDQAFLYVLSAALIFIVGHEIAHAAHGHLEFKLSKDFQEFCKNEDDLNLTLKTLEMDADSSATSAVYDIFEREISSLPFQETVKTSISTVCIRNSYVLGAFLAIVLVDTLTSNYNTKRYPIGYARFITVYTVLMALYDTRIPEAFTVPERVRTAMTNAFVELSGSMESLGYPMASNAVHYFPDGSFKATYDEIGYAAGVEHLDPLYGRWARIRPHLEKYLRGGRLAPASAPPI